MIVDINLPFHPYKIHINELKEIQIDSKVAIITNEKVSSLHLDTLLKTLNAKEIHIIKIGDGEKYKNIDSISYILDELCKLKLDRSSVLIAFGGGVIGDMTGFAASIYLRGVDFIQIPTTLLSQVDSSVGGKTGVNNKFGKNLIGTFHQPQAVYCENKFLKTLDQTEFSAGMAEIIKIATMFDKEFFEFLENADLNDNSNLQKVIARSVELKADVVIKDEKEHGIRSVLNYGHTFAHVVEQEGEYETHLHGEAVAIGMMMANMLAVKLDLLTKEEFKRIKNVLKKYNLPTTYTIKDVEKFYNGFFLDKKTANNKIKFILPHNIGKYKIMQDINKDIVISALNKFKGTF